MTRNMNNVMQFEEVKHEVAQEVFEGTEYNWMDMMDNTNWFEKTLKGKSEEECYQAWKSFFGDFLEAERDAEAHA